MSGFLGKKRAQAAVEFLTTYGWAIMAVIIVIGALSYFDLLDSKRFVSERCDVGSQIQCVEAYTNDDGDFEIALRNNYPVNIIVERVVIDGIDIIDFGHEVPMSTGISSNFVCSTASNDICLGLQQKGSKEEYDVLITFRRDAVGATNSYNISGGLILKVQDADDVPLPDYGICGDGILNNHPYEDCDSDDEITCYDLGHYDSSISSERVTCDRLTCQWDESNCVLSPPPNLCGNGALDAGETCDSSAPSYLPSTCDALGLPGGATEVQCKTDCTAWDTSLVCVDVIPPPSQCTTTNDCPLGDVCIEGNCKQSCDEFTSGEDCGMLGGCRCSVGAESYLYSGICVTDATGVNTFCDTNVAVKKESNFISDCAFDFLGFGCDDDSLAGGYNLSTSDVCINGATLGTYICGTDNGGIPGAVANGGKCTAGNNCSSGLCVYNETEALGRCTASCEYSNNDLCSYQSDERYDAFGVCVREHYSAQEERASICDKTEAALYEYKVYSTCEGLPDGEFCDSNELAGGISFDGRCYDEICKSLTPYPGDECKTGNDCASTSNLCVNGYCATLCYIGQDCSNNENEYDKYGICTRELDSGQNICDDKIAVYDDQAVMLYSDCHPSLLDKFCDSTTLENGFNPDGICYEDALNNVFCRT
ncbi:MAG: hypothetical protein ACP5N2_03540 [Candidatus Nanoarchaeia archaeon]